MYLSTSTSTEDFPGMYLSTIQVLYKLYLSTDVLKYKVLLPGSGVGVLEGFEVKVGLHQGSTLSPCLFTMVMERMTDDIREEAPWTMMFADDIVICSESKERVKTSWRVGDMLWREEE